MSLAVLCDFDGTVVEIDTCDFLLGRFAEGDWRSFDEQLRRGAITVEECMRGQFSLVRVSKEVMLEELDGVVSFRPGFEEMVEFCGAAGLPLFIVSAGLDFVIDHFLEQRGLRGLVRVYSARTISIADGIGLTFPRLFFEGSVSFKDDLVRRCKIGGGRVFYIGDDDIVDIHASRLADMTFAIRDSGLSAACRREKIPHREIGDFREVIAEIKVSGACL